MKTLLSFLLLSFNFFILALPAYGICWEVCTGPGDCLGGANCKNIDPQTGFGCCAGANQREVSDR